MNDETAPAPTENVWIVVPAYNESTRIKAAIADLCGKGFQVVVVDDGSRDGTSQSASDLPVWILKHPFNCGQGAAIRTGIEFALSKGATHLVTFDADGQHDCDDVKRLLEPVLSHRVDVALGTRFKGTQQSVPMARRILLWAAVLFTRMTTGLSLTDSHNGFRAFSRRAAETIRIQQPRMAHASEILDQIAQHQLSFEEVSVTVHYTSETLEKGQSTWDALRIGGQLILGRFVR